MNLKEVELSSELSFPQEFQEPLTDQGFDSTLETEQVKIGLKKIARSYGKFASIVAMAYTLLPFLFQQQNQGVDQCE